MIVKINMSSEEKRYKKAKKKADREGTYKEIGERAREQLRYLTDFESFSHQFTEAISFNNSKRD